MPPEELRRLLRALPFLPFRIHLDDNRVFEVRRPELVLLGRHVAVLGVPEAGADPHPYIERHETIRLLRVVRLEPLTSTEGARPRVAAIRSEVLRLRHAVPFRPFALQMENGQRVVIRHPESIAFRAGSPDGTGGSKDFYAISDGISLTGAFAAVTSIDLINPDEQTGGAVTRSDLLAHVRQRPFRPFRLIVSEGAAYDIRHPEQLMVLKDMAVVGLPSTEELDLLETAVEVDLFDVVRLEPLETPAGGQ